MSENQSEGNWFECVDCGSLVPEESIDQDTMLHRCGAKLVPLITEDFQFQHPSEVGWSPLVSFLP
jgi:hypothetical protein